MPGQRDATEGNGDQSKATPRHAPSGQSSPCVFSQINEELIRGCRNTHGGLWATVDHITFTCVSQVPKHMPGTRRGLAKCLTDGRMDRQVGWWVEHAPIFYLKNETFLYPLLVLLVLAVHAATETLSSSITDINCKLYFCIVNSASSLCI